MPLAAPRRSQEDETRCKYSRGMSLALAAVLPAYSVSQYSGLEVAECIAAGECPATTDTCPLQYTGIGCCGYQGTAAPTYLVLEADDCVYECNQRNGRDGSDACIGVDIKFKDADTNKSICTLYHRSADTGMFGDNVECKPRLANDDAVCYVKRCDPDCTLDQLRFFGYGCCRYTYDAGMSVYPAGVFSDPATCQSICENDAECAAVDMQEQETSTGSFEYTCYTYRRPTGTTPFFDVWFFGDENSDPTCADPSATYCYRKDCFLPNEPTATTTTMTTTMSQEWCYWGPTLKVVDTRYSCSYTDTKLNEPAESITEQVCKDNCLADDRCAGIQIDNYDDGSGLIICETFYGTSPSTIMQSVKKTDTASRLNWHCYVRDCFTGALPTPAPTPRPTLQPTPQPTPTPPVVTLTTTTATRTHGSNYLAHQCSAQESAQGKVGVMSLAGNGCCRFDFLTNQADVDADLIRDVGIEFMTYYETMTVPKSEWSCQQSCEDDSRCIAADLRDNVCTKFYGAGENFVTACAATSSEMCWRKMCGNRRQSTTTTTVTTVTATVMTATATTTTRTTTGCSDFSGQWIDDPDWYIPKVFTQDGCAGSFDAGQFQYTVVGNSIQWEQLLGSLWTEDEARDEIRWSNGKVWKRYKGTAPTAPPLEDSSAYQHRILMTAICGSFLVLLA